jgi:hypothetical protein
MHLSPDPKFEEFALDCIRLSKRPDERDRPRPDDPANRASFLCRNEDEVRQKARELGLVERPLTQGLKRP